jgi:anti-sigma28 factor (negative regulator of flagellin synthesis)
MKVPGSERNNQIKAQTETQRVSDQTTSARISREGGARGGLSAELAKAKQDTMTISSLGALLKQELNPSTMADERAQKVANLKEQVQNGRYSPATDLVAASIGEEISLEVLFGGGALRENEG